MIDFADIKERVSIDRVFPLLGLQLKEVKKGEQWRGPCPSCQSGGDRALVITKSKAAFFCFGAKRGGDVIALVAHISNLSQRDAAALIAEQYCTDGTERTASTSPRNSSPEPAQPRVDAKGRRETLKALDYLVSDHPAIGVLGLSAVAIEALGGGYAPKGTMIGRVLVPLRLPDGTLVGYFGIATKADQAPLLKFPDNLDERIGQPVAEPEAAESETEATPDQLRKLFRVIG